MLIDGGESNYGKTVHDYLVKTCGITKLDLMVLTHYNKDHGGGLQSILIADNVSSLADVIADVTVRACPVTWLRGASRAEVSACIAGAVCSAALGNVGADITLAILTVNSAKGLVAAEPKITAQKAAELGAKEAEDIGRPDGVGMLVASKDGRGALGCAVGTSLSGLKSGQQPQDDDQMRDYIRNLVLGQLQGWVKGSFWTDNIYNKTVVVDLGPGFPKPAYFDRWQGAIDGVLAAGDKKMLTPKNVKRKIRGRLEDVGVNRSRITPKLGSELLWTTVNGQQVRSDPPDGAPTAYVISAAGYIWQGQGRAAQNIATGADDNVSSIGLIFRFNAFSYFTAGDMPVRGEDLIVRALKKYQLRAPAGHDVDLLAGITAFKCSHHGSQYSTSSAFLREAKPVAALISCGNSDKFEHPHVEMVQRLQSCASLEFFYLTNCCFQTPLVPASMGENQNVPGNKSRQGGENDMDGDNLSPGRKRGDIHLDVTDSESRADAEHRLFTVEYFDDDDDLGYFVTDNIEF